jgi:hypothetical protein
MQQFKHIKYTKLSPILVKNNTFPNGVVILSHVGTRHRGCFKMSRVEEGMKVMGMVLFRVEWLLQVEEGVVGVWWFFLVSFGGQKRDHGWGW